MGSQEERNRRFAFLSFGPNRKYYDKIVTPLFESTIGHRVDMPTRAVTHLPISPLSHYLCFIGKASPRSLRLPSRMAKKSNKKRQRSSNAEEKPALYAEDIGTKGIKHQSTATSTISKSIHPGLPLTEDEQQKRKQRQVCFGQVYNIHLVNLIMIISWLMLFSCFFRLGLDPQTHHQYLPIHWISN